MNDKYSRIVYEYAATRVKSNPISGAQLQQKDLHWKELTDDVYCMMQIICLLRQIHFLEKCGQKDIVREKQTDLETLKQRNKKFFEVANYFDTQKLLDEISKEVSELQTQLDNLENLSTQIYDEVASKKRKASLVTFDEMENVREVKREATKKLMVEKMAEFNQYAESIGLVSHYILPTDRCEIKASTASIFS